QFVTGTLALWAKTVAGHVRCAPHPAPRTWTEPDVSRRRQRAIQAYSYIMGYGPGADVTVSIQCTFWLYGAVGARTVTIMLTVTPWPGHGFESHSRQGTAKQYVRGHIYDACAYAAGV
ncbi:hypothetical protein BCR34DRAFT_581273, partial [Clohesyomyces aquaticus]